MSNSELLRIKSELKANEKRSYKEQKTASSI